MKNILKAQKPREIILWPFFLTHVRLLNLYNPTIFLYPSVVYNTCLMDTNTVRRKYLEFFKDRGHAVVPSASLVPDNDSTTLFTGSGMQPMLPYFLGEKHPEGKRVADSQKCFRAEDIEEVGDNRHTTFFEMLGNWSFGDYFKEEQLRWCFQFLTEELGLNPEKLYVTVYAGDSELSIPRDDISARIWQRLFEKKGLQAKMVDIGSKEEGDKKGMQGGRIFFYGAKENWWSRAGLPGKMPAGEPGGPDSEVFYDFGEAKVSEDDSSLPHPNCDSGRFLEIGNSVFMEYVKEAKGNFSKLSQRNVDFGGGLERLVAASLDTPDVFQTDPFQGIIHDLENLSGLSYEKKEKIRSFRIIADHLRGVLFMMSDGVFPSNTEAGYFVRRLIRRAVRHMDVLGINHGALPFLIDPAISSYVETYPELRVKEQVIKTEVQKEEGKFRETLKKGLKQFQKIKSQDVSGKEAFVLFSTYGFPFEMTQELATEKGMRVDKKGFYEELAKHQKLSRSGADKKFKGGLSGTGEKEIKYHTASHLLLAALEEVLGNHVEQRGSNITPERLRLDFSHPQKITEDQKKKVELLVNEKIGDALPVTWEEISLEEARQKKASGVFDDRYRGTVKVYRIGKKHGEAFSLEICGGPHVENSSVLGNFRIIKEESVSQGVRRIKAVLD